MGAISITSWDRRGVGRLQLAVGQVQLAGAKAMAGTKQGLTVTGDAEARAQLVVLVAIHLRPWGRTLAALCPTATATLRSTDCWLTQRH